VKTADLAEGLVYAVKERTSVIMPGLLLDKSMWHEMDKWAKWDGSQERTRNRIIRKAAPGARAAKGVTGWRDDYSNVGLPVLVLKISPGSFSESAGDEQIVEAPLEILERARDNMNVMALVADDHDGRLAPTKRKVVTIRVATVTGAARKVPVELELVRPQQVLSQWGPFVKELERAAVAQAELAQKRSEQEAEIREQAQDFARRVTALLGDDETVHYTADGERYDFRRAIYGPSNSYEVKPEVLARLLELAEKGASA